MHHKIRDLKSVLTKIPLCVRWSFVDDPGMGASSAPAHFLSTLSNNKKNDYLRTEIMSLFIIVFFSNSLDTTVQSAIGRATMAPPNESWLPFFTTTVRWLVILLYIITRPNPIRNHDPSRTFLINRHDRMEKEKLYFRSISRSAYLFHYYILSLRIMSAFTWDHLIYCTPYCSVVFIHIIMCLY